MISDTFVTLLGNFVPFIDLFSRKAEYRLFFCSEKMLYETYTVEAIPNPSQDEGKNQDRQLRSKRSGTQTMNSPKMTRSRQTLIFANKNDQKIIIIMTIITAIDNAIIY